LVTLTAAESFRTSGVSLVPLGLSPLCGLEQERFKSNRLTRWLLCFLFEHGSALYPFKGNHVHKSKYCGRTTKVYFSSTRGNHFLEVLVGMKALGLV